MIETDISAEIERAYVYPTGVLTIKSPVKLIVDEKGNHTVIGKDGYSCKPEPGYLAINILGDA